jgi:hypothetical protein
MNQEVQSQRCCETCLYQMRSETSTTGFRCGYEYYRTPRLIRKFKTMSQYPVVRTFTVCESWKDNTSNESGDIV